MKEFEAHPQPDHPHTVRRVVLPSGKTIEVVSFEAAESPAAPSQETPATDLHVCGDCRCALVYPTDWLEAGDTHWEVDLRCPNCEWTSTDVFPQEVVDRFDEELDRGTAAVERDLRSLTQANMEDEVERFCAALDAGHVLPEDF